jgi:glycerol uptake facilitator-like aquaporin
VTLARRAAAEAVGTALLLATVVGSGIMAERLAGGNVALALLANTVATAGALAALIYAFGPVSGAHLNPAVTLLEAWSRRTQPGAAIVYVAAQCAGAIAGVALANVMFGLAPFAASHHERSGPAMLLSEAVATFGLIAVIRGTHLRQGVTPFAVAAYIAAAYWFTPSTSFANPAVTLARSLTDTFAGIRPADIVPFVIAQLLGAAAAAVLFAWLVPATHRAAPAPPRTVLEGDAA